ncbi:MAG TPA: hypothetical protein VK580_10825 [Steroidobacteraceae bacterium]|nr:hypothetical protein [Steroidobacteraceae bacterium]
MDNVTTIRPIAGPRVPSNPPKAKHRRQHGSAVQRRNMEMAIDDQRMKLWEVGSIIESVALALEAHFSRDWPAAIPHFPMALRIAARMINDATGELEMANIEEEAKKMATEGRDGH